MIICHVPKNFLVYQNVLFNFLIFAILENGSERLKFRSKKFGSELPRVLVQGVIVGGNAL